MNITDILIEELRLTFFVGYIIIIKSIFYCIGGVFLLTKSVKSDGNKLNCYIDGLRAGVPLILGYVPAAIAYALIARQAGFTVWQTCAMSMFVFTGAGQMLAVGMYARGASMAAILIATTLLGLRHIIMSICCMNRPSMRKEKTAPKLMAAFGITDESFSVFCTVDDSKANVRFLIGVFAEIWLSWNIGTLIGALASDFLPAIVTASLSIALYAMFTALLTPELTHNGRLALLVLMTAVCNTILGLVISPSWALIISTLVCAFIGVFFVDLGTEGENDSGRQ